jgi:copper chaperone
MRPLRGTLQAHPTSRPARLRCTLLPRIPEGTCGGLTYPPPLYSFSLTPTEEALQQATLYIEGMSCGHCLNAVNRALSAVPGVRIDAIRIGRADVRYDESTVALPQLEAAVAEAGYRATAQSTTS